ncbi:hypothetical protein SNEBB_000985 [Seison nebaliae]|nr:hypothetical protein SNEBB_000985 [Seison nebaliae]
MSRERYASNRNEILSARYRSSKIAQPVAHMDRVDLEEEFIKLKNENLELKKQIKQQEEKIRKMATKLIKLARSYEHLPKSSNVDIELQRDNLEKAYLRIEDLERQNQQMREKISSLNDHITSTRLGSSNSTYSKVVARIDTGLKKGRNRGLSSSRLSSARLNPDSLSRCTSYLNCTNNSVVSSHHTRDMETLSYDAYSDRELDGKQNLQQMYEELSLQNRQLEDDVIMANQELKANEQTLKLLQQELERKEKEHRQEMERIQQIINIDGKKDSEGNVQLIRLQREVREKDNRITMLQQQSNQFQDNNRVVNETNEKLLKEIDQLNHSLKNEKLKISERQTEMSDKSIAPSALENSLRYELEDVKKENEILKETNGKLMSNAFNLQRETEFRERERLLKLQVAQLEGTLKSDLEEKTKILEDLKNEKMNFTELNVTNQESQLKYLRMKEEYDELKEKLNFFESKSAIDEKDLEEALLIIREKRKNNCEIVESIIDSSDQRTTTLQERYTELEIQFTETVSELEKTRDLLQTQHDINRTYRDEMKKVEEQSMVGKERYDRGILEYVEKLDKKNIRISQLEKQLKDIAYGTYYPRKLAFNENDLKNDLAQGENVIEIQIIEANISDEGNSIMQIGNPSTFISIDFYQHPTQYTPIVVGRDPKYNFVAQYVVNVDDFLIKYLMTEKLRLVLLQSLGTDYHERAAARFTMKELLRDNNMEYHGHVLLTSIEKGESFGMNFGSIQYVIRLKTSFEHSLKLYRQRAKALGYFHGNLNSENEGVESKEEKLTKTPSIYDEEIEEEPVHSDQLNKMTKVLKDFYQKTDGNQAELGENENELIITLIGCSNLRHQSNRKNMDDKIQSYAVYRFYNSDDHCTGIIPYSNNPNYSDTARYRVNIDLDLSGYLKMDTLDVYVFDDGWSIDNEYLGKAEISLLALIHNKKIRGNYKLTNQSDQNVGTIQLAFYWTKPYHDIGFVEHVEYNPNSKQRNRNWNNNNDIEENEKDEEQSEHHFNKNNKSDDNNGDVVNDKENGSYNEISDDETDYDMNELSKQYLRTIGNGSDGDSYHEEFSAKPFADVNEFEKTNEDTFEITNNEEMMISRKLDKLMVTINYFVINDEMELDKWSSNDKYYVSLKFFNYSERCKETNEKPNVGEKSVFNYQIDIDISDFEKLIIDEVSREEDPFHENDVGLKILVNCQSDNSLLGFASIPLKGIYDSGKDIIDEDVELNDNNDELTIGEINISVQSNRLLQRLMGNTFN